MDRFMRRAMFPAAPEGLYERVDNPSEVTYVSLKTGEEITSEIGLVVYFATPAVLAVLYALSIMFMTGQLGSAVVREKEQRAMEIVITSLRPSELVAGKILGMALLALTQFGIWITGAVLAVVLFAPSGWDLQSLVFPWGAILWALPLILIGFLLFAVLGAGAGIIAGDSQQAQQVAALIGLLGFAPMWFLPFLIEQSESVLAVALTLFPLTATTVALIRMAFSEVPLWQLSASLVLLVLGLGLSTCLVARIFRAAMLIYGQTLRPVQIWRALRQA
jgi:ABC-2 type transport system permease protein